MRSDQKIHICPAKNTLDPRAFIHVSSCSLMLIISLLQGITLASAKAVAAGKSCKQVDVSACANLGRKAVGEMLQTCKAASKVAESDDDRERYILVYI